MRLVLPLLAVLFVAVPAVAGVSNADIAYVNAKHEELNNKKVRIRGWIRACDQKRCDLTEEAEGQGETISLGQSSGFDKALAQYRGLEVEAEVEATVHRKCFDHASDEKPPVKKDAPCTGRTDQLASPRLLRVNEAHPLPANGSN